jgi:hypothetical protein
MAKKFCELRSALSDMARTKLNRHNSIALSMNNRFLIDKLVNQG